MARKLTKDDIVQYSFRLNLNIDSHLKIHQMLQRLSADSKGAKSRFIIDSLVRAVSNSTDEDSENPDNEFVTRGEMKKNNDKLIQEFSADIMARIVAQTVLLAKAEGDVPQRVEQMAVKKEPQEAEPEVEINNDMLDMINHYSQM